ncbi:MAG: glycosyltransferase family 4 protein [Syntrophales bacterium]
MTTILLTFIVSFLLSLVLTPLARRLGFRYGVTDMPGERKVHTRIIPRCGGVVILLCFFLALFGSALLRTRVSLMLVWDAKIIFACLGALVAFGVGLYDDFHRLGPKIKFFLQIVAASLAFFGGLRIVAFNLGDVGIHFGVMSWFVTVFWFLLFINAMNLIDGLDGLASGVAFFACVVMIILSLAQANYLSALEFAALGGGLLGFLRYNFNPASIFLGDGGSYFIGYTIAALAILGSNKSQIGATLLIPLLALGVPIFDAILSPVRRFMRGRRMFLPDKGHIHHKLLKIGFSSQKAVMTIYCISALLCVASIMVVHAHNKWAGLMLAATAAGTFLFVRRLGYLEYFAVDKISGWLQDVMDVAGISAGRRSFLSLQIEIGQSKDMDELWKNTCQALEKLRFDRGEIHIPRQKAKKSGVIVPFPLKSAQQPQQERRRAGENTSGHSADIFTLRSQEKDSEVWVWTRGRYRRATDTPSGNFLKVEVPLGNGSDSFPGSLSLCKDICREPLQPYTLRRVEHLRRTLTEAMPRLLQQERAKRFVFSCPGRIFDIKNHLSPARILAETQIARRVNFRSILELLLHRGGQ